MLLFDFQSYIGLGSVVSCDQGSILRGRGTTAPGFEAKAEAEAVAFETEAKTEAVDSKTKAEAARQYVNKSHMMM